MTSEGTSSRWWMTSTTMFTVYVGATLAEVVGAGGLLSTGGLSWLLALWLFDAAVTLASSRAPASRLVAEAPENAMRVIAVLSSLAMVLLAWLTAGSPSLLSFAAISLLARVYRWIAVEATWAFGRRSVGTGARSLARLRALATAGSLVGAAFATLGAVQRALGPALLFGMAALYLLVERQVAQGQRDHDPARGVESMRSLSAPPASLEFESLRSEALGGDFAAESVRGLEGTSPIARRDLVSMLRESRSVRVIAALRTLYGVGLSLVALEMARLFVNDPKIGVSALTLRFGVVRIFEVAAAALGERVLGPAIVRVAGAVVAMSITPLVLFMSVAALALWPSSLIAVVGVSALRLVLALEAPALSSVLTSLPRRLRGPAGFLFSATSFSVGAMGGFILLGGVLLAERTLGFGPNGSRMVSCLAGSVASAVALVTVRRLYGLATSPDDR